MSHTNQLKIIHLANHILALIGIFYMITYNQYVWGLIAICCYSAVNVIGHNIGLHRYLSHRSFETHPVISYIICFFAVLTTTGSPLSWVAMHRTHHKYCDTPEDPHSPVHTSIRQVIFSWETWGHNNVDLSTAKDMLRSKLHQFIHKYYSWLIIGYCLVLMIINPLLVVFVYSIPAVMSFYSGGIVNAFSHYYGYRNHNTTDNSTNNIWASIYSIGEGWHNNHHYDPRKWRHGEKWWEIDPPAFLIKIIKR